MSKTFDTQVENIREAIQMIEQRKVAKVTLNGVTIYRCQNIIRIDIKEVK